MEYTIFPLKKTTAKLNCIVLNAYFSNEPIHLITSTWKIAVDPILFYIQKSFKASLRLYLSKEFLLTTNIISIIVLDDIGHSLEINPLLFKKELALTKRDSTNLIRK